ncbi:MAG: DUF692 domain-containing protein [Vampirovibrio sp.]|nr:DUF692 domain-containing protein [Vampirovibrio sp.]
MGVGLGLRRPLVDETLTSTDLLDWVEVTPENYMGKGGRSQEILAQAKEVYPLVSHGVSLSIGSVDPWDSEYLRQFREFLDVAQSPWFSDHLCFSGVDGVYFHDLIPLPRTKETVAHCAARIRELRDRLEKPVLVENVSYYLRYPEDELSEADFVAEVIEQADCGLLLDVNNVYVNTQNHGGDPYAYFSRIPLERVVQIHTAGHHKYPEGLVDTHGSEVCEDVWTLLAWVLERSRPCGVMIERDTYIPAFEELKPEIQRLRQLWEATQGTTLRESEKPLADQQEALV